MNMQKVKTVIYSYKDEPMMAGIVKVDIKGRGYSNVDFTTHLLDLDGNKLLELNEYIKGYTSKRSTILCYPKFFVVDYLEKVATINNIQAMQRFEAYGYNGQKIHSENKMWNVNTDLAKIEAIIETQTENE